MLRWNFDVKCVIQILGHQIEHRSSTFLLLILMLQSKRVKVDEIGGHYMYLCTVCTEYNNKWVGFLK